MRPDAELLGAWKGGDKAAGAELFDRHFRAVARFFRNKAVDDLDDLVQATFLGCLESIERFRGESSFRTYLFGVARNVLFNAFRKRRGDKIDFSLRSVHDLQPRPSEVLAHQAEHRMLLEGLRRIPLELQVILELYYWERMSAGAIGEALDAPEGTVRTRIKRAKELLAQAMSLLAGSGQKLETTVSELDDWAAQVRTTIDRGE